MMHLSIFDIQQMLCFNVQSTLVHLAFLLSNAPLSFFHESLASPYDGL